MKPGRPAKTKGLNFQKEIAETIVSYLNRGHNEGFFIEALSPKGVGGIYAVKGDLQVRPMGQPGADLMPNPDRNMWKLFPFCVECKIRKEIAPDNLAWALTGGINEWWQQAESNAPIFHPLLIFKQNFGTPMAVFNLADLAKTNLASFDRIKRLPHVKVKIKRAFDDSIYMLTLHDFMVILG
ncbi:MAG: hypothetical protein NWE76_00815, partial [Candidatus Bathyarchaeota archaeon]|nr:hypothetical protein [Candidatus Bathyarchaeota archaeon]